MILCSQSSVERLVALDCCAARCSAQTLQREQLLTARCGSPLQCSPPCAVLNWLHCTLSVHLSDAALPLYLTRLRCMQVLIADFFFVLLALAWFIAGLGQQAALRSNGVLDAWYALWQPVFQPALGVLMLGAIVSGIAGRQKDADKQR